MVGAKRGRKQYKNGKKNKPFALVVHAMLRSPVGWSVRTACSAYSAKKGHRTLVLAICFCFSLSFSHTHTHMGISLYVLEANCSPSPVLELRNKRVKRNRFPVLPACHPRDPFGISENGVISWLLQSRCTVSNLRVTPTHTVHEGSLYGFKCHPRSL